MKYVFFVFLVGILGSSQAQIQGLNNNIDLKFNQELVSRGGLNDSPTHKIIYDYNELLKEYSEFEGSPLLFPESQRVDLYDKDGAVIKGVEVNYDLLNHNLFAKNTNGELTPLDLKYYSRFSYQHDGVWYNYRKNIDKNGNFRFDMVFVETDKFIIYKEYRLRVYDNSRITAGVKIEDKRITRKHKYYYHDYKNAPKKIKLKQKDIEKNLPRSYSRMWRKVVGKGKTKKSLKSEEDYLLAFQEMVLLYQDMKE